MLKLKIKRPMKRHAIFGTFYATVLREAYRILENGDGGIQYRAQACQEAANATGIF